MSHPVEVQEGSSLQESSFSMKIKQVTEPLLIQQARSVTASEAHVHT